MAQEPASRVVGEGDAPEMIAVDVRDPVVACETLIDERVVGVQQIQDAPILAQRAVQEQFRLLLKRIAQVLVEVREDVRIGQHTAQPAKLEPLRREVVHERSLGPRVGQQTPGLLIEHLRLSELAAGRQVHELAVGKTPPQER